MRRRPGTLLPLEVAVLEAGLRLRQAEDMHFHGYQMARLIAADSQRLTAHGTLYKALARLEAAGLLTSTWEDADRAAQAGRPRRRLYVVTGAAEPALAAHRQARPAATLRGARSAWT